MTDKLPQGTFYVMLRKKVRGKYMWATEKNGKPLVLDDDDELSDFLSDNPNWRNCEIVTFPEIFSSFHQIAKITSKGD